MNLTQRRYLAQRIDAVANDAYNKFRLHSLDRINNPEWKALHEAQMLAHSKEQEAAKKYPKITSLKTGWQAKAKEILLKEGTGVQLGHALASAMDKFLVSKEAPEYTKARLATQKATKAVNAYRDKISEKQFEILSIASQHKDDAMLAKDGMASLSQFSSALETLLS